MSERDARGPEEHEKTPPVLHRRLADAAAGAPGEVGLLMGEGHAQVGCGDAGFLRARDHVAADVIGLDHRALLQIMQHGGSKSPSLLRPTLAHLLPALLSRFAAR